MTVGSRSTKMARGTCLPAPVSLKNVLKASQATPTELSLKRTRRTLDQKIQIILSKVETELNSKSSWEDGATIPGTGSELMQLLNSTEHHEKYIFC